MLNPKTEVHPMIWNHFEADRAALGTQYTEEHWDAGSGLSPEALRTELLAIERAMAGQPAIAVKTRLYEKVLASAQLDVDRRDFFPEKLHHDFLLSRIRGRWMKDFRAREMAGLLAETDAATKGLCYTGDADFGHTSPDWEAVLTLGIPGLRARVLAARDEKTALTEAQRLFYACTADTLTATIGFIARLADATDRLAADGDEKMRLVSSSLRHLTVGAPETLLEAMQLSVIFYNLQCNVERDAVRSIGGLDRLFYPFYRRDLACGRLTEAQARELFRYYFFKFYSMHVTANVPFYIGGRLADGSDATNALTYLLVEEYIGLDINDPKIHVRWHKNLPKPLVRLILGSIRDGRNSFVFLNDEVVEGALVALGEAPADARNYTVIGCYEPAALGKEVPCTCTGRVNLPKAVLVAMNGGVDPDTGAAVGAPADPDSYADFDAFYAAVLKQIAAFAAHAEALIIAHERAYPSLNPAPLFSATLADCVARGVDAYSGGAKYNNSAINAICIASTVDALAAVRRLVYEEKKLKLSEFAAVLRDNWQGHAELRQTALHRMPKYGNGDPAVDALAAQVMRDTAACINGKPNGRGGVFRCGFFSIDYRLTFGEKTGATADGRLAGEPLSKNMCAVTAMDREGVTALIRSATAVDYTDTPNGTVLDVVLYAGAVEGDAGICAMETLLETFMARRGFAMQINVLSPAVLRAAQENPEKYATLQVRLCGWNVYFTALSRVEQDEFIRQTENAANA